MRKIKVSKNKQIVYIFIIYIIAFFILFCGVEKDYLMCNFNKLNYRQIEATIIDIKKINITKNSRQFNMWMSEIEFSDNDFTRKQLLKKDLRDKKGDKIQICILPDHTVVRKTLLLSSNVGDILPFICILIPLSACIIKIIISSRCSIFEIERKHDMAIKRFTVIVDFLYKVSFIVVSIVFVIGIIVLLFLMK